MSQTHTYKVRLPNGKTIEVSAPTMPVARDGGLDVTAGPHGGVARVDRAEVVPGSARLDGARRSEPNGRRIHFEPELDYLGQLLLAAERPWLRMQADDRKVIPIKAADTKPPDSRPVPEQQRMKGAPEPFLLESMYGIVGEIVEVLTPWTEAPPTALYASLLSYAGGRIVPGAWVMLGQTRHTTRLWFALVGGTGVARKGTGKDVTSYVMDLAVPIEEPRDYVVEGLSSGEGLADIFKAREDRRLIVFESEFARFLTASQRDGNILGYVVRSLWDHPYFQNFSKNTKIDIQDAHLTFLGHMTMEEFRARANVVDFFSGSYNRFIFVFAERERMIADPREINDPRLPGLANRLGDAIGQARELGACKLTKPAKRLWEELYYGRVRPVGGPFASITDRWDAHTRRLALTLAALDGTTQIRAEHIDYAHRLWQYSEESVRLITGGTTGNANADKLLDALRAKGELTRKQIRVSVFAGNITSTELDTLAKVLEPFGVRQASRSGRQGRPAEIWSVT